MDKFGRVYIKTSSENGLNEKLVLLPSIRFSNVDHKWYDLDGNIHPDYEKHRGREFSLGCKIQQHDENGVLVPFEGEIKMLYKLGEMGHQDFAGVGEADKEDFQMARSYNLLPDDETVKQMHHTGPAAILAACFPDCDLSAIKLLRVFVVSFFQFDDDMEKIAFDLSYDDFDFFLKSAFEIVDGKPVDIDEECLKTRKLGPLLKYLDFIKRYEEEISKGEKNGRNGKYVREHFKKYLEGTCFENSREWGYQKQSVIHGGMKELRLIVAGSIVCLEMALFDANIQVKAEIRETFLFKWFVKLYAQQACWINDLLSFRKEMEKGHDAVSFNKVCLYHHGKGFPLEKAMSKVLEKTNGLVSLLVDAGQLLCQLYADDKDVPRFVAKTKDVIYGNIQWMSSSLSERYHNNLIYDCILEEIV